MHLTNDAEFESALESVSAILANPPLEGTAADHTLGELLAAIESYQPALPTPSAETALTRLHTRANDLGRHAEQVRRAFERIQHGQGFGGLPFDGEGLGPTTGG